VRGSYERVCHQVWRRGLFPNYFGQSHFRRPSISRRVDSYNISPDLDAQCPTQRNKKQSEIIENTTYKQDSRLVREFRFTLAMPKVENKTPSLSFYSTKLISYPIIGNSFVNRPAICNSLCHRRYSSTSEHPLVRLTDSVSEGLFTTHSNNPLITIIIIIIIISRI